MGISAEQWGKQAWHLIHTIAFNYPDNPTEEDKQIHKDFVYNLQKVLPCPYCANHFKDNLEKFPPRLDNQKEFFNWSVDIHNEVNKANGKRVLNYDEALNELYHNLKTKEQIEQSIRVESIKAHMILSKIKKLKR